MKRGDEVTVRRHGQKREKGMVEKVDARRGMVQVSFDNASRAGWWPLAHVEPVRQLEIDS